MNAWAVPWKEADIAAGAGIAVSTFRMAVMAAPMDASGARLNDTVVAGNWPRWPIRVGAFRLDVLVKGAERNFSTARRSDVDIV